MKLLRKILTLLPAFVMAASSDLLAQCAMCRATVENNVSNGEIGIGAGLNFGILYLFVMPYLAIGVVGFLWYRKSKADAKAQQSRRYSQG
ncbi:hypothetical protein C900_03278 [Fulvivirga imtechensis AK7]|uniref:Uncharacterized protein n=1 Tax=Fulvivirga imtechensis AK7 TaxID=1237149 RepID=L8JRN3_9BACT|nr:hypothetical protein [Fulvivirga imtechensis]ELR70843.1 hypothetical protein C900_03278 [Fulvivirga imtechensis AK7]